MNSVCIAGCDLTLGVVHKICVKNVGSCANCPLSRKVKGSSPICMVSEYDPCDWPWLLHLDLEVSYEGKE